MYAAAYGVLGDATLAQDVVQDVFLRLWRRPTAFDPSRGDLGAYLRLMGRSRALDLWRETQVRGRAADRLKLVGGQEEPRAEEQPEIVADRAQDTEDVREALGKLPEASARRSCSRTGAASPPTRSRSACTSRSGTAKSRIRLGLARLRDEFAVAV